MIKLEWPSRRTIVVAAASVIVLIAIAAGIWYWESAQQRRAAEAYAAALAHVHSARAAEPTERAAAVRELETVLQSYPSASMAPHAAFELGSIRYADRQYPAARRAYEIAATRGRSRTLQTLARLAIAYTWEGERDLPKATDAFAAAVKPLTPTDPFFEEALLDLARVQELAGKKDEAVQTYRRVLKEVPASRQAEDVRSRLASLGATP